MDVDMNDGCREIPPVTNRKRLETRRASRPMARVSRGERDTTISCTHFSSLMLAEHRSFVETITCFTMARSRKTSLAGVVGHFIFRLRGIAVGKRTSSLRITIALLISPLLLYLQPVDSQDGATQKKSTVDGRDARLEAQGTFTGRASPQEAKTGKGSEERESP
jgi:hypothetical protein